MIIGETTELVFSIILCIDVPIYSVFVILPYKYPLDRHSHVAHLISLGFTPVEIAERLGHEGISVTYTYSHLYPTKQKELADRLDADHGNGDMLDGLTERKESDTDENAE